MLSSGHRVVLKSNQLYIRVDRAPYPLYPFIKDKYRIEIKNKFIHNLISNSNTFYKKQCLDKVWAMPGGVESGLLSTGWAGESCLKK